MLVAGSFAQQKTRRGNALFSRRNSLLSRKRLPVLEQELPVRLAVIRLVAAIDDGVRATPAARRRRGRAAGAASPDSAFWRFTPD
jgi:hypothetical protein